MPPNNDDVDFVEKMSNYACHYLQLLETHAAKVRGDPQLPDVYERAKQLPGVVDWDRLSKSEADRENYKRSLERVCEEPASSPEEHVRICWAAQRLLALHNEDLGKIEREISLRVTRRITEIRSVGRNELRASNPSPSTASSSLFRPLVPRNDWPEFPTPATKPPTRELSESDITHFFENPLSLLSQTFVLCLDPPLYFRVVGVTGEVTTNGLRYEFKVQYNGVESPEHPDVDELRNMLDDSEIVLGSETI